MIEDWTQNRPPYPAGSIFIWTNSVAEIPPGWVVCDGNNGTPDLLDRFVKSVPDATTDPGATGGSASITLDSSHLPAHTHTGDASGGGHSHKFGDVTGNTGDTSYDEWDGQADGSTYDTTIDHSHSATTDSTGGTQSIDNRPNSVEVLYIQKL